MVKKLNKKPRLPGAVRFTHPLPRGGTDLIATTIEFDTDSAVSGICLRSAVFESIGVGLLILPDQFPTERQGCGREQNLHNVTNDELGDPCMKGHLGGHELGEPGPACEQNHD